MHINGSRPTVAFLGPEGTYSHQVAYNRFGENARYVKKASIADLFYSIPDEASIAVIPRENSIYGSVVETHDLFRDPKIGKSIHITEEITLQVQHCLLAAHGTELADIKRVFSHEQALGQCSHFFANYLPDAIHTKTPSTAAAAEAILDENLCHDSAAVCSEICTRVYPGLRLLRKGIQNETNNYTKFFVLSTSPNQSGSEERGRALLRVFRPSSVSSSSAGLGEIISQIGIPISQIDRRPLASETPFSDVYFITVSEDELNRKEEGTHSWYEEVQQAVERLQSLDWQACILGCW